ncbi:MAG: choice-of-anchor Q domain-containing protein [Thermomicrobiales bacterium]
MLLFALVLAGMLPSVTVGAATDHVKNCAASGPDSLASVVAGATAGDLVVFDLDCTSGSPILLASAITINSDLTIDGSGHIVVVSRGGATQAFIINSGAHVTLMKLTITNAPNAIGNSGTLAVVNSTFSGNVGLGAGGAITNSGMLDIRGSTFVGNQGGNGGVIYNGPGHTTTISNSTFSGNSAPGMGAGGALTNSSGTLTITNSTVTQNGTGGVGGGIYAPAGTTTLTNTIVAGNSAVGPGPDISGTATSGGHNLIGDTSGSTGITNGVNGDIVNPTPLLGSLASNGGPTQTIALLAGSPALDAGDPMVCAAAPVNGLDQRGLPRPTSFCSIGAFEPQPSLTSIAPSSGSVSGGSKVTLTGTRFAAGATVSIGNVSCTNVSVVTSTEITCTTGAHGPGTVDVVVTVGNQMGTLPGGYTYGTVNPLPGLQPTVSPTNPVNLLPVSRPTGVPISASTPVPLPPPRP